MKKTGFNEQQIAFILRQAEEGTAVGEVCMKAWISEATYYNWRKKYGGMMPGEYFDRDRHLFSALASDRRPVQLLRPRRGEHPCCGLQDEEQPAHHPHSDLYRKRAADLANRGSDLRTRPRLPQRLGNVESYANLYNGTWVPLLAKAGLVDEYGPKNAKKKRPWFAPPRPSPCRLQPLD